MRDKDRKQFTREYLKYWDTEKYEEQKREDHERKRLAKKGGKKRQLQHQRTKIKNTPVHHHRHSNTNKHSFVL